MRLIDADALDEALTALRFTADGELAHWGDRKDWCLHGSEIEMLIANAPTVEAESVRHGKWIEDDIDKWRCSVCQKGDVYALSWSISEGYELQDNYCPHCGAKMDEVNDETD